jgi:nitroreductase
MNASLPDAATIRTVLGLASRAPSVHNTQPWRWRVEESGLHLYSDVSRQLPNTDPDGGDLILSCGAALNYCVVAWAAFEWRAKVTRLPDPADSSHLAAITLATFRRCCFAWGGRRSTPTHYRPHRGVTSPKSSSGARMPSTTPPAS